MTPFHHALAYPMITHVQQFAYKKFGCYATVNKYAYTLTVLDMNHFNTNTAIDAN